jgi:octaprenyl-diphosphate synthase
MMVDVGSMRIMQTLADATNVIAEGEVLQLMNMHDASLDEEGYLRVIRFKTAKLFEASARLGAILAGSSSDIEAACADYGQALGTAFQVIDDVLDYDGNATEMGKNLGDDLREGKATLPLILAIQRGNASQSQTVREAIETGSVERLADIVAIVLSRSLDNSASICWPNSASICSGVVVIVMVMVWFRQLDGLLGWACCLVAYGA